MAGNTVAFCQWPECQQAVQLTANAYPAICPHCNRIGRFGKDRPPVLDPTVLNHNDRRMLESFRIQPWEGGLDPNE